MRDSLSVTGTPVRDSRGRFFTPADGELTVLMFDSTGVFRRTIGRPGQGPGEFSRSIARIIVGRGDSLFVFHGGNRVEVFSPTFTFVRRITLPAVDNGYTNTVAQIEGGFVFEAQIRTTNGVGQALHILNAEGEIERSFAPGGERIVGPGAPTLPTFVPLFADRDGRSFWTTTDTGFTIQQWSRGGELLASYAIANVPWVTPVVHHDTVISRGNMSRRVTFTRQHSRVQLVGIDKEGRLWIESTLPGNGDPRNGHPMKYAVHVFDPRTRTFLLSEHRRGMLPLIGAEHAMTGALETNGILTYVISRVTVRRN